MLKRISTLFFVTDLASRLSNRVQITTDGHSPYLEAVENAFGMKVDYSILQKIYGSPLENETRYSLATCIGVNVRHVSGNPDAKHISTSYIERQNWTGKMRRYTRLSNGFSRTLRNHAAATALNYFAYNFIQIHSSLRTSPAQAAGVTDKLWDVNMQGLESQLALLKNQNQMISHVISANTNKKEADIDAVLRTETILNPDDAKSWGLVQEIRTEFLEPGAVLVSVNNPPLPVVKPSFEFKTLPIMPTTTRGPVSGAIVPIQ